MKTYRRLWMVSCAPVTVLLSLGLVLAPVAVMVLGVSCGAIAALSTRVWLGQSEDVTGPPRTPARVTGTDAILVGSAVGAAIGSAVVWGAGVLLLVVLVLATSPYVVSACGRWRLSVPTLSMAQLDRVARALSYASPECLTYAPSLRIDALTDEELCQSWRASFTVLQHRVSPAQMAATVAERQSYLDELERRNPQGLAAWLASGAQAPGDPLPYLSRGPVIPSAINWDELTGGRD